MCNLYRWMSRVPLIYIILLLTRMRADKNASRLPTSLHPFLYTILSLCLSYQPWKCQLENGKCEKRPIYWLLLWGLPYTESALSGWSRVAEVNNDLTCNNLQGSRMHSCPENYLRVLPKVVLVGPYTSLLVLSPFFNDTEIYLSRVYTF